MKRERRLKRFAAWLVALAAISVAAIEIVGRWYGLTDITLMVPDADTEYRFAPNQDLRPFGRRVFVNEFSMRSPPLKPGGPRVLVLGDSIPWGGTQVDQADLATSRLASTLSASGRAVQVLNASAASWGPPNELAYVKKFGDFGADVAVVIVSSQDADDLMKFDTAFDQGGEAPTRRPWSVTGLLATRYGPRFVAVTRERLFGAPAPAPPADGAAPATRVLPEIADTLRQLAQRLRTGGRPVVFVLHNAQNELTGDHPLRDDLKSTLQQTVAAVVDTRDAYRAATAAGRSIYRDNLHLNTDGQAVLGDVLFEALRGMDWTAR